MTLTTLLENETTVRLSFFIGVFLLMALWESLKPCRTLLVSKPKRWLNNLALVVLNSIVLRLIFPTAAIGMATFAEQQQWGLLNYFSLPEGLAVLLAVILLDLVIYFQHVLVHALPMLWRLHRVHHSDLDFDVTTGLRFHPLEILFSMTVKFAAIILLGPAAVAVLIFEVILNGAAMFNHSNISLPPKLDRVLRWVLVTPDMHRIHHSVEEDETNSNFGFNLPWWDRLFGTYRAQPRQGQQKMNIGLHGFESVNQCSRLHRLLLIPFSQKVGGYVLNRRSWPHNPSK
ncbi:MAG: sterol desaturase family protein [Gammaproteobacteria bacterium]|nr:sterol desaturase family protein [Gammaproteobacteria bacterium]